MRVAFPVAVARNVTSPESGPEPETGDERDDRPDIRVGRVGLEVVEN